MALKLITLTFLILTVYGLSNTSKKKKLGPRSAYCSNDFHTYYNAHTFIVDDATLRDARLNLIDAVRQVLANGLGLLGVSAPETM